MPSDRVSTTRPAAGPTAGPTAETRPAFVPVPAIVKAVTVLEYVSAKSSPVTLHAISTDLSLPKSSTLGICRTLVSEGLLEQDERGTYSIGLRMVRLAGHHLAAIDLAQVFNRVVGRNESPMWTIQLAVLDHTQVVYLARRDGLTSISLPSTTGRALPASTTAVGKILLAQYPESHLREIYAGVDSLPRPTPASLSTIDGLIDELRIAKYRGYATDQSETVHGVLGVAAPVRSFASALPVAAVSIAVADAPNRPAPIEQLGTEVMQVAAAISTELGA